MAAVWLFIVIGREVEMGIEHRYKDEPEESRRCPWCNHVSIAYTEDGKDRYFYCQNPLCDVERIYGENAVMISGRGAVTGTDSNDE